MSLFDIKLLKFLVIGDPSYAISKLMKYFFYSKQSSPNDKVDYSYISDHFDVEGHKINVQVWAEKLCSKQLSKYKGFFNHFDGILFVYDYTRKESFETIENIIKLAKKDVKPGALLSLLSLRVNANRDRVIDIHKAVQVSHVYSLYFTKEFLNMDIKCANSVLKRMIVGTLEEKKRQIQQESGLLTRIYGYFSKKIKCDENEMILRKVENHGTLLKLQRDLAYEKKKAKEEEEWTERVIEGGSRKDSCVYIEDVQEEEEEREGGEEGSYEVRNCERECCTSKEPREVVTEEVTSKGEQHSQLSTRVGGKEDGNTGCQVEISIRKEPKDRKETTKVLEKDVNNLILNEDYQKEEIDPLKKEDKEESQTIQCEKSKVNQIEIETS